MKPDFNKTAGKLIPAIIQDNITLKVLMLGYMNEEAFEKTKQDKRVTFFSRSKNRLWTKGEESKNYLTVNSILMDCDADTLLIKATPLGPVCHTGADTCFTEKNNPSNFLNVLEKIISDRKKAADKNSYVSELFAKGINKIAQKVGEESVELIIEAKDNNKELFLNEAADLLFHYLILLNAKDVCLIDVIETLENRNKK
ncbi:MAG: bifunctional phosphoribosyl-AMP cyclohydrolase/phosphoribosyl-ATP diphosphatase HisIE [Bacteroidia bacterium]|nr:bifunctional phosphoribosyl-AMP cyclohydrolase/phosphoribosyl-ATP diphosphatase HisIE [Bacteroidia bacterium]